jgi:hypothetical protein
VTKPADLVIAALAAECPRGEAMSRDVLMNRTGLGGSALKQAIQSLRYAGKLDWDRIALAPSLRIGEPEAVPAPVVALHIDPEARVSIDDVAAVMGFVQIQSAPEPGPVPAPSMVEQVREEARQAGRARKAARAQGSVASGAKLSVADVKGKAGFDGTDLQALAIDEPGDAVRALQLAWGDLWPRLVAQARAAGARPIPHMVALLEAALGEGARA